MNNLEKLSTVLTFVMLIVAVTSTIWTDYRLESQTKSYASGVPTCTAPGPICHGCKDVYTCDDQNRPSKVWTCNATQTCNNGKCVNTPNFECSEQGQKTFPCQMEGLFPDPGNCFKYHICVAVDDTDNTAIKSHDTRTCKNLYSYNASTGYCDKKMSNSTCQSYAVPICTEPAQSGPLKDNPSIYYTCRIYEETDPGTTKSPTTKSMGLLQDEEFYQTEEAILYPYLKICSNGKQYDPTTYSCK